MSRRSISSNHASTGRTILCVDDQVEFLESTRALLEREGHFRVRHPHHVGKFLDQGD